MAMTPDERLQAYQECQKRGHSPIRSECPADPSWSVCQFCGTHYRTEWTTIESNKPEGA